jgi:hypothetical protein
MTKKHSEFLFKVFFDPWFKQTFILAPFLFTVIFVAYNAEMGGKSHKTKTLKNMSSILFGIYLLAY